MATGPGLLIVLSPGAQQQALNTLSGDFADFLAGRTGPDQVAHGFMRWNRSPDGCELVASQASAPTPRHRGDPC